MTKIVDKNSLKTETGILGTMFELDLICTFVIAGFLKILNSWELVPY